MSLKVHVVKRKVRAGENAGKELFYGQVRQGRQVPLEDFCEAVSSNTSATPADVEMVVNALVSEMSSLLKQGNIIEMATFGNFRVSASSKGAATREDFKCWMMHRPRIIFTPGKMLKEVLESIRFGWLPVIEQPGEVECNEVHG